ncbi:iron-containing redox enzyme family protein [Gloeobacter violaceus]|uniref:Gll3163 protein n=1 Tax=Gloeobacter violaceus (strain ATCC 29082 / PCC 7421) TaxID=251221 RepID=Q7NGK6_GLOVI|nr:iron-containing redox enzyme family protein [Gloeobacter violaceus]BAC91104.1 gll3163 [Gloeobacter violaceus PCC 7421]
MQTLDASTKERHSAQLVVSVHGSGDTLCLQAAEVMRQVAARRSGSVQVLELPLDPSAPLGEADELPVIAFGQRTVYTGCPTLEQAEELLRREEIASRVSKYAINNSAVVRLFAEGKVAVDPAALAHYYPISLDFPIFLARAIGHVRDENARLLLVGNLYEEHGNLDASQTHPELFRNYIRALDLNPDAFVNLDNAPAAAVVERYNAVCAEGPDHRALAMLYGFEKQFSPICTLLAAGLRRLELDEDAVRFFDVHSEVDVDHAEQLRFALFGACDSPRKWEEALEVAVEASGLLYDFFDTTLKPVPRP